jgi:hypothetical protein
LALSIYHRITNKNKTVSKSETTVAQTMLLLTYFPPYQNPCYVFTDRFFHKNVPEEMMEKRNKKEEKYSKKVKKEKEKRQQRSRITDVRKKGNKKMEKEDDR